jgi:hypothetical protein
MPLALPVFFGEMDDEFIATSNNRSNRTAEAWDELKNAANQLGTLQKSIIERGQNSPRLSPVSVANPVGLQPIYLPFVFRRVSGP